MGMDFDVEGISELMEKLESLGDPQKVKQLVGRACAVVADAAIENAAAIKDSGLLSQTIAYDVTESGGHIEGVVYSPLEYAPYVEYGTGLFAEKGGRTDVPWVYVKGEGNSGKEKSKKSYTEEKAKQVVAILRSKGLDAHMTNGQKPQPFMRPALNDNKEKIMRILKGGLLSDD